MVEQCLNCGAWRTVDEEGYVQECPNCGDDEYNIHETLPFTDITDLPEECDCEQSYRRYVGEEIDK